MLIPSSEMLLGKEQASVRMPDEGSWLQSKHNFISKHSLLY